MLPIGEVWEEYCRIILLLIIILILNYISVMVNFDNVTSNVQSKPRKKTMAEKFRRS